MADRFDPLAVDIPALLMALGIDATRRGVMWRAKCPGGTHEDNDPSWDIRDEQGSPKHGLHHCLSCKLSGTATELVQRIHDFALAATAREWIAKRAMGEVNPVWSLTVNVAPLRSQPFALPASVVTGPLESWHKPPRDYVVARGITPEQVRRWGIGYSLTGRLNGRIVFPTLDINGRAVNYTARTYVQAPKRYTTPPRACMCTFEAAGGSDLMCDGECGFTGRPDFNVIDGEYQWPAPNQREDLVLTEGVFNRLAVERVTPLPTGALNGSHISLGQVSRLSRFKRVINLTDQDFAGDRADEAITDALTRHVTLLRVKLPTRCAACQHELAEHVKGSGCRCCPAGKCRKWMKEDPASMRAEMLMRVLEEHGLPTRPA